MQKGGCGENPSLPGTAIAWQCVALFGAVAAPAPGVERTAEPSHWTSVWELGAVGSGPKNGGVIFALKMVKHTGFYRVL